MGRLLLTVVLGVGLFAFVAWYFEIPLPDPVQISDPTPESTKEKKDLGASLYVVKDLPPLPPVPRRGTDSIMVNAHLSIISRSELSAHVDGQLLFVGEPVPDGTVEVSGAAAFISEPFRVEKVDRGGQDLGIFYRQLKRSDTVREDQVLAMLDTSKALNEKLAKTAKMSAARAEFAAAAAASKEADVRLIRARDLYIKGGMSAQDYSGAQLMASKFKYEADAKDESVKSAKIELDLADFLYKQHFIRNELPHGQSIVKMIAHQGGDAVKHMEPFIQLYSEDQLLAEGMIEASYENWLKRNMPVIVEPSFVDPPLQKLYSHRQEVTSIAISGSDVDPLIVSGSKDKMVCVWSRKRATPLDVLYHPDEVNVVACSPRGSKGNWLLSGCADGSIRLWNLDDLKKKPVVFEEAHQDGVTALTFSPDGQWFASGGADNDVCLWNTETGKKLYGFAANAEAHQGAVTSLEFTPQSRLVSASRDNTLRVWALHQKGPRLIGEPIMNRGGAVQQLGVSDDGRWMLFDQDKTLQVLSVDDGRTMTALHKPQGATPFETVAIFSPDASFILTAGAADGRLQLWKTPLPGVRGFEVRQLSTKEGSPVTCAAFSASAGASDSSESFAASGSKDGYVYIWQIPSAADVDNQRIHGARLNLIERTLDAGAGQMRIGVELRNLSGQQRLIPGLPVTIVIDPLHRGDAADGF